MTCENTIYFRCAESILWYIALHQQKLKELIATQLTSLLSPSTAGSNSGPILLRGKTSSLGDQQDHPTVRRARLREVSRREHDQPHRGQRRRSKLQYSNVSPYERARSRFLRYSRSQSSQRQQRQMTRKPVCLMTRIVELC